MNFCSNLHCHIQLVLLVLKSYLVFWGKFVIGPVDVNMRKKLMPNSKAYIFNTTQVCQNVNPASLKMLIMHFCQLIFSIHCIFTSFIRSRSVSPLSSRKRHVGSRVILFCPCFVVGFTAVNNKLNVVPLFMTG